MKNLVILFSILCLSFNLHAQIFRVEVTDYSGLDSIGPVKNFIDSELLKFQNQVNEDIPNGRPARIMEGMANTSILASSGANSDYSSNLEVYLVGLSMSSAVDLERDEDTKSDISGVGLAPSLLVGANLSKLGVESFAGLDAKRLNAYVNVMKVGYEKNLTSILGYDSDATANSTTLGFKLQYQWLPEKEYSNATWGGVKLHWGYQFNESQFTFDRELNEVIDFTNGSQNFNATVVGRPKFEVDVKTHSIPLEISTDVRLFKFLSFFGGGGINLNYGTAVGKGKGDVVATPLVCTDGGAICGGGRNIQMQIRGEANADSRVDPVTGHIFLGTQINLPYIQIYGQIDNSVTTEIYGASVGIRFVK